MQKAAEKHELRKPKRNSDIQSATGINVSVFENPKTAEKDEVLKLRTFPSFDTHFLFNELFISVKPQMAIILSIAMW